MKSSLARFLAELRKVVEKQPKMALDDKSTQLAVTVGPSLTD